MEDVDILMLFNKLNASHIASMGIMFKVMQELPQEKLQQLAPDFKELQEAMDAYHEAWNDQFDKVEKKLKDHA